MKKNMTMELQVALMGTGLVQPVDLKSKGGHLEVLCRLVPGQEKPWLQVMSQLLEAVETLHVCRRYVLKGGQMVFGYHIGFEFPSVKALSAAVTACVDVLSKAKPMLTVVEDRSIAPTGRAPSSVVERVTAPQKIELKVTKHEFDEQGNEIIEEVMPLPHVRGEMNKPARKGGRGASRTAASTR